jgi:hypothetical protein
MLGLLWMMGHVPPMIVADGLEGCRLGIIPWQDKTLKLIMRVSPINMGLLPIH